jgi:hypothetical protein
MTTDQEPRARPVTINDTFCASSAPPQSPTHPPDAGKNAQESAEGENYNTQSAPGSTCARPQARGAARALWR